MSHGSIGIVQRIEFEIRTDLGCIRMYNHQNVEKSGCGQSVCVCLALAFFFGELS